MPGFVVPDAVLDVELSDEGGAPVVQLHGLTSSRARDRLMNLDLGRGLSGTRLLRYDARAHGRSSGGDSAEQYRWPVLADDLLRLLDVQFPGERVHGVGPSMGAATLLHAAVREPDRFSGLTLMIPPTAWETRAAKADDYRTAADLVERCGVEAFIASGRDVTPPPATADVEETLPDVVASLLPTVLRGAAASDLPDPEALTRIALPVHVLAWVGDPGHPLSTAERLVELIPDVRLTVARTPGDLAGWPEELAADVAGEGGRGR